ncbi:MAG: hypothetical protein PF572_00550 [Patescibacteria group bacterium]|jgi:hypothetical protein|nr:hypothetical protein [Patescibacteria group bacterium]
MALTYLGEKTRLKIYDHAHFNPLTKELSLVRFQNNNTDKHVMYLNNFPYTLVDSIKNIEDFYSLCKYLGNISCLNGKLIKTGGNIFIWKFTSGQKGSAVTISDEATSSFESELKYIKFSTPIPDNIGLQSYIYADGVRDEYFYDSLLRLTCLLSDSEYTIIKEKRKGPVFKRSFSSV